MHRLGSPLNELAGRGARVEASRAAVLKEELIIINNRRVVPVKPQCAAIHDIGNVVVAIHALHDQGVGKECSRRLGVQVDAVEEEAGADFSKPGAARILRTRMSQIDLCCAGA